MDETIIKVEKLLKQYGNVTVLNGISFKVKRGEIFGLLGPNGAGKTTTLECLEGIRKADGGSLFVAGCNPQGERHRLQRKLGVQLQASSLPDSIRTDEVMSLVCAWHGIAPRVDLLSRFGLEDSLKKQYHTLSTGQKRRLHLALSISSSPEVIILDEPTAGLDVQGRARLHEAIRSLKSEGITIMLATHDMAEAEVLCDRIAIIIRGKIAAIGTPAQITAAGKGKTRITIRTTKGTLFPGSDTQSAQFAGGADGYGEWTCDNVSEAVMDILKKVQMTGDTVLDLRVERPSLEERFLELIAGGK